jgi:hypothetical protein
MVKKLNTNILSWRNDTVRGISKHTEIVSFLVFLFWRTDVDKLKTKYSKKILLHYRLISGMELKGETESLRENPIPVLLYSWNGICWRGLKISQKILPQWHFIWGMMLTGERQSAWRKSSLIAASLGKYSEANLFHCHIVRHRPYMNWPAIEAVCAEIDVSE